MDKRAARQEQENTFAAVAQQFIEAKRKEWRVRTHSAVELHLLVYAVGLQGRPITAITQRDICSC